MTKLIGVSILMSTLAACVGDGEPSPTVVSQLEEDAAANELAAAAPDAEFVELGLDQFSSPFTKETVLRLNAIVGRSLAAIREYDGAINAIERSIDAARAEGATKSERAKANDGIAQVARLSVEATAARADLGAAEAALTAGREQYNEVILAGMTTFVAKVDDELRLAKDALSARLGGG
jgi:hypothetical protein